MVIKAAILTLEFIIKGLFEKGVFNQTKHKIRVCGASFHGSGVLFIHFINLESRKFGEVAVSVLFLLYATTKCYE